VTGAEELGQLATAEAAAAAATPAPATGGAGAPAQGEPAPAYRLFSAASLASTSASASTSGAPSSAAGYSSMTGTAMPNFIFPQMGTSNMVPLLSGQPSTSFVFSGVQTPAGLNRQMVGSLSYCSHSLLVRTTTMRSHTDLDAKHDKEAGGGRSSMR
jgi:hypothetical protein